MTSAAVDNDVLLKLCLYGLHFKLREASNYQVEEAYFLGAARFLLPKLAKRKAQLSELTQVLSNIDQLLGSMAVIEPEPYELELAAQLETVAAERNLSLDFGESQLCAIVVSRSLNLLITGDKRAIEAVEQLLHLDDITPLSGKLVCLEQLISSWLKAGTDHSVLRQHICSCPTADKTLAMCFSCRSNGTSLDSVLDALSSYIEHIKQRAPNTLAD